MRQREMAQNKTAQGFIQSLDNYKRFVYDTQADTDSRDKCWFRTPAAACADLHIQNSVS